MTDQGVPQGFELMPPFGPFHELVGPMYWKRAETGFVIGLRTDEKHRNRGDMIHGGMIAMLADTAFTWASKYSRDPPISALTTQISVSMMGKARVGDWLEAQVEPLRSGRRVVFLNCYIWAGGERIAQATAQFQVIA